MVRPGFAGRIVAAFLVSFSLLAAARAQDLTSQLPAISNAAAVVDVKALLASKIGTKEGWQGKLMGGYSSRPLAVPAYANQFALAAFLEIPELSPMWQIGFIDTSVPVDLSKVAAEQRGIADKIDGHSAVTTRFNIMHVAISEKQIATIWPAQRQLAARLISKNVARGPSEYIRNGIKLESGAPIAMAMDLNDAFSGASIRKVMAMGGLASLDQAEDIVKVSEALASVRGVTVKVMVDDSIRIKMAADFEKAPPIPAAAVEQFCLDVLATAGIDATGFADLDYQLKGNQITASGDATTAMVQALLGLLVPDATNRALDKAAAASTGTPPPGLATPSNPAAAASLEYYRAIAGILDRLQAGSSMTSNAARLRADTKKIQQLPVLNVDPDLLNWGMATVDRMNQCAMILNNGQLNAQNAAAAIESPVAEASYADSGYSSTDTAGSRANFRNAQQQRRQAAQTARQQAFDECTRILTGVSNERQKLRMALTQKYGVEF